MKSIWWGNYFHFKWPFEQCVEFVDEKLHQIVASDGSKANATIITASLGDGNFNLSSLDDDVWEVLQSQFEKSQEFNPTLNGNNQLQLSEDGTQFQFYQNGNGKQQYLPNEDNGGNNGHFIENGGSLGNGNGSSSSNKTVMESGNFWISRYANQDYSLKWWFFVVYKYKLK